MYNLNYKSFCWSFGTTSFRTKNFNKTIELQLMLLDEFWKIPGYNEMSWDKNIMISYIKKDLLKEKQKEKIKMQEKKHQD